MDGVLHMDGPARRPDAEADAETASYLAFADAVIRALIGIAERDGGHVSEGRILLELGRPAGDRAAHALLERMCRDELIAAETIGDPFDRCWRLQTRGRRLAGALSAALDERLHATG
jgi:hypothetical protein